MSETSEWSDLSVSELKDYLRERGMPVTGRKEELVRRVEEISVFQAEIADSPSDNKGFSRFLDRIWNLPFSTLVVISILVIGGSGGAVVYGDEIMDFIQGDPEYLSLIHI